MKHDLNQVWVQTLDKILTMGHESAPRGKRTTELFNEAITVSMDRPVLTIEARKLSYQFMAAEAFWILSGDDSVEGIAPWNKHISQFSDDGVRFFGAYGPKVMGQMPYVAKTLRDDADSRQAGLTIWRESPPPTKDVPCTVAMFFRIVDKRWLNCFVFMRSSDAWLGLPYDVFNFSMISHALCAWLIETYPDLRPGHLKLTMVSSHLYEPNWEAAREIVNTTLSSGFIQPQVPQDLYGDSVLLVHTLNNVRNSSPGDPCRWWERP